MTALKSLIPAAVALACMAAAYLWVGAEPSKERVLVGGLAAVVVALAVALVVNRWLPAEYGSESMAAFSSVLLIGMLAVWFGRYYTQCR